MKKQRKSGTAHYFFLVYIIKEEKISDARFGTPAYCIETTVKTGRISVSYTHLTLPTICSV